VSFFSFLFVLFRLMRRARDDDASRRRRQTNPSSPIARSRARRFFTMTDRHASFFVRIVDVETTEWVSSSGATATIEEVRWGEGANATRDAQEKPSVFLTRTSRTRERIDIGVVVSCFRPCATRGRSSSGERFF